MSPPRRNMAPFDPSDFLEDLPAYEAITGWSCEDVLEHIPSGSAGPGGVTGQDLQNLHCDSVEALARLLSEADKGRLPCY